MTKNKIYSESKAKQLARKYLKDLTKKTGINFVSVVFGSMIRGEYKPGKSDIDIIFLPAKKQKVRVIDWGRVCFSALELMEEYKKFGTVFKKGRDISIIDAMIIVDTDMVKRWQEDYYARSSGLCKL